MRRGRIQNDRTIQRKKHAMAIHPRGNVREPTIEEANIRDMKNHPIRCPRNVHVNKDEDKV